MIPTRFNRLGLLPAYSARLNYLAVAQSGQYIDTDYVFDAVNSGSSLEIKVYFPTAVTLPLVVFGARRMGNGRDSIYSIGTHLVVGDASDYSQFDNVFPYNQETVFRFDAGKYSFNGGQEVDAGRLPATGYSFIFFNMHNGPNITPSLAAPAGTRIYYCKFWEGGNLACNVIPVLDRSGVPCFFDTVSQTFKYNAGTGTFNYA